MEKREVIQWITVKGVHVPIFEGQTKADAIKEKFSDGDQKSKGPQKFKNGDTPKVFDKDARYHVVRIDSKGRERDYGWLQGSDLRSMMQYFHYEELTESGEGFWTSKWYKYMYDIKPEGEPEVKKDPYVEELTSILGEKKDVDPIEQLNFCMRMDNMVTNPNLSKGGLYRTNCALCTAAVVLQARGYDVEAMPRDVTWRGCSNIFDIDYSNPNNYMLTKAVTNWIGSPNPYETRNKGEYYFGYRYGDDRRVVKGTDIPLTPRGAKAVTKAVIDKVRSWGNGAVGELTVLWEDRGHGHSLSIINHGGNVIIYDGQTGRVRRELEFEWFFKGTSASSTTLVRLDNAPLKIDNLQLDSSKQRFLDDMKKMVRRRKVK